MRRKGVVLTGLAMIAAGLVWAAVAWASTAVEITKPSGNSVDVTIKEDDYDIDAQYKEGDDFVGHEGRSLKSVLKQVGIGDQAWTSITIEGITVQNGSFRPKKPPIFILKDNDVKFYKPQSGSDPLETRTGSLDLYYRVPLVIKASDNSPEAGQKVTYEASVPRGGPQGAYEFTWTPSSGTAGTGPTFKYTYPETTGEVTINVSAKRGSDKMTVGTSTTAAVDIKAPPPENTGGGFTSPGGSSFGFTPPSNYDYNFPDSGGSTAQIPDTPKTPDPDEAPPLEELGTSVEGELLSATAPLPPSSGDALPADEAAPDPEKAIEEAEEISGPGALIAAGVVVGLLGLGAGREMETVRPRRLRRPNVSGLRRLLPPWK